MSLESPPQTLGPLPLVTPPPATVEPATSPPPTTEDPSRAPGSIYRPKGKIASLRRELRDLVNQLLLDGHTYSSVIKQLAEHDVSLNHQNLSSWHHGGYQDWLRQRQCLDHLGRQSEFSTDLLATPETPNLHEAGLRLAASHMLDQLMRLDAALEAHPEDPQPEKFARLVNALSRLTREATSLQKYHDLRAQHLAAQLKRLDPNRDLSGAEDDLITRRLDDFFKKSRRTRSAAPAPREPNPTPAPTPAPPPSQEPTA